MEEPVFGSNGDAPSKLDAWMNHDQRSHPRPNIPQYQRPQHIMADGSDHKKRIAVLISGSGSNLQALMDACSSGHIPNAEICLVFSNHKNAFGLERARTAQPPIPTSYLALKPYLDGKTKDFFERDIQRTRETYDQEVARIVAESRPDLIVLAGWMHILSPAFLDVFSGKQETIVAATRSIPPQPVYGSLPNSTPIINLHPALPGAFDGANAIQRAYDAFQNGKIEKTGIMVHYVISEVDKGEPIVVKEIELRKEETLTDLEGRIHEMEHKAIVEAAARVLE